MRAHDRLEQATWDLFWVPDHVTVVDRPGFLATRSDRPVAHFINTVLRAVAPEDRIDALVDEGRRFHDGGASRWQIADTRPVAHLEAALARAGYAPGHRHEARGIAVDAFRGRGGDVTVHAVDSVARLRDCLRVAEEAFGRAAAVDDDGALARDVAMCSGPGARLHRFVAYDRDGAPVASGSMTSHPAFGLGSLWGGGTVPSARGRGAYLAVLAARVTRARELGLAQVGLYARVATSAPIVARLGFERWGEMTYWQR